MAEISVFDAQIAQMTACYQQLICEIRALTSCLTSTETFSRLYGQICEIRGNPSPPPQMA